MSINQPNEGGLHNLRVYFAGYTPSSSFQFKFYTTAQTWNDNDVSTTNLIRLQDYNLNITATNLTVTTAVLGGSSPIRIQTVLDVPQVEFPMISLEVLSSTTFSNLYGYALYANDISEIPTVLVFREMFNTPVPITAGTKFSFIPIFRIGNTTCLLT